MLCLIWTFARRFIRLLYFQFQFSSLPYFPVVRGAHICGKIIFDDEQKRINIPIKLAAGASTHAYGLYRHCVSLVRRLCQNNFSPEPNGNQTLMIYFRTKMCLMFQVLNVFCVGWATNVHSHRHIAWVCAVERTDSSFSCLSPPWSLPSQWHMKMQNETNAITKLWEHEKQTKREK